MNRVQQPRTLLVLGHNAEMSTAAGADELVEIPTDACVHPGPRRTPFIYRRVLSRTHRSTQSVGVAGGGDAALAVVEALDAQSPGVPSLSAMAHGGSQSGREMLRSSSSTTVLGRGSQSSSARGARSLALDSTRGSQSSSAHFLAGMTKTVTFVSHETDRVNLSAPRDEPGDPKASTGRTELRRKRDASRDAARAPALDAALGLPVLRVRRGLAGIWRNHDTGSMLRGLGLAEKCCRLAEKFGRLAEK